MNKTSSFSRKNTKTTQKTLEKWLIPPTQYDSVFVLLKPPIQTMLSYLPSFSEIFVGIRRPASFLRFPLQGWTSPSRSLHLKRCWCKLSGLFVFFVVCCCSPNPKHVYIYIYNFKHPGIKNGCSNWMIANILLGKWLETTKHPMKKKTFQDQNRMVCHGGAIHSVLLTGACWATGHSRNGCLDFQAFLPPRKSKSTIRIAIGLKAFFAFMDGHGIFHWIIANFRYLKWRY